MGKTMMKNYENMQHPAGSLKESVDSLRLNIRDLYELDEDNYQMNKNLQKALDQANNRINALTRKVNRNRAKTVLGFIGIGGLIYLANKAFQEMNRRVLDLELEILERPEVKPEEKEESDG